MHPCFGTVVDWIDDAERVEAENRGDVHDYSAIGKAIEVRDDTDAEVHGSTDIGINLLICFLQIKYIVRT